MSVLKSKEEAIAFAKFLAFERQRHLEDLTWIDHLLRKLSKEYNLTIKFFKDKAEVEGQLISKESMWVEL